MNRVNRRAAKTTKIIPDFSGGYVDYYDDRSLLENIASELDNVNCKRPPNMTSTPLRERKKTFTNEIIKCIGTYLEKYLVFVYIDIADAGKTKLGYLDPDVLTLVEIGQLTTSVSSPFEYYQLTDFNGKLYIGYNDKLFSWDGDSTFTDVTTIPSEWDVNLLTVKGYRMYAIKVGGDTLFYSDNGNDNFTASGAGTIPVESSKGLGASGLVTYADSVVIFTKGSMHKLIGSGPDDYWFKEVSSVIGCVDNESIVEINGYLYFRSWDGVYVYDGSNIPTKIDIPIERTIREVSQTDFNTPTKAYQDNMSYVMYYGKYGVEYDRLLSKWFRRDSAHLTDDGDVIGFASLDDVVYSIVENDSTSATRYLCQEDSASSISEFETLNSVLNPNFADTSDWAGFRCTISALANMLKGVNTSTSGSFNIYQNDTALKVTAGDPWFFYAKFKSTLFQLERVELYVDGYGYLNDTGEQLNPTIGQAYELYKKVTMTNTVDPGFYMIDFYKENNSELAEVELYGDPGMYAINLKEFGFEDFEESDLLAIAKGGIEFVEQMKNTYNWISGEYDYFDQFKQVYLGAVKVAFEYLRGPFTISLVKQDETEVVLYEKEEFRTSSSIMLYEEVKDFDEEIKITPANGIIREPFKIKISGRGKVDMKKVTFLMRLSGKIYLQ